MEEISEQQLHRIIEIAQLYYKGNKTQQEIAHELNISRPLVSNLLLKARELDIVRIDIKDPYSDNEALINYLKEKYHIKGGSVVSNINDYSLFERVFIKHAVRLISELLIGAKHIGIGWGYIIDRIISRIPSETNVSPEAVFVPLVGSINSSGREFHTNELVRKIAETTSCKSLFLNAPPFPLNQEEHNAYINTSDYQMIASEYNQLDLAIITISSFPTVPDMASANRLQDYPNKDEIAGELLSYYYLKSGEFVDSPTDFAIRIPFNSLKKAKAVLAIISNTASISAVQGLLKSGIVTHIVLEERIVNELNE